MYVALGVALQEARALAGMGKTWHLLSPGTYIIRWWSWQKRIIS